MNNVNETLSCLNSPGGIMRKISGEEEDEKKEDWKKEKMRRGVGGGGGCGRG